MKPIQSELKFVQYKNGREISVNKWMEKEDGRRIFAEGGGKSKKLENRKRVFH